MHQYELHITNGDSAVHIMSEAGIPGKILPWRDILHDGPVPAGLDLAELATVRARFLDQPAVASFEDILQGFHERDQTLESAPYLGDWSYWNIIEQLTNVPNALLKTGTGQHFVHPPGVPADETFRSQQLGLTQLGSAVLRGEADWIDLNPPDRWKGGVHLRPDKTIWRWDARLQTIEAS